MCSTGDKMKSTFSVYVEYIKVNLVTEKKFVCKHRDFESGIFFGDTTVKGVQIFKISSKVDSTFLLS